jgi:type II secretory pathway pseudopilin PulG
VTRRRTSSAPLPLQRRRAGTTLIELLISMVVVAIIGAALTRTMISSNRFIEKIESGRESRGTARAAVNLAATELRMVSAGTGVESATDSSVTVRVPFRMGLVCSATVGSPAIMIAAFQPADTTIASTSLGYNGYAWLQTSGEYRYVTGASTPIGGGSSFCTNAPASMSLVTGGSVLAMFGGTIASAIPVATPIVLWRRVVYEFGPSVAMPGRTAFWRRTLDNAGNVTQSDELAAPVNTASRFGFFINNNRTSSDTVPTALGNLRGLELRVRGESVRTTRGEVQAAQSRIVSAIFFLNRPD